MEKFKVSVIIPIFNAQKFLKNCLNTFKEQTIGFNNIELIFVNDCSTDNTKKMLEEFSEEYSNCKIFNLKENSGYPAKPLNIGIEQVTSDFLMFMDQDDTYAENMCEVLYNTIIGSGVDFVMCNHDELVNGKSIVTRKVENLDQSSYNPNKDLNIFNNCFRWDKIFNTNFIRNNNIKNPDDNVLGEDTLFCVNAYLNTNKVIYLKNFYGYNYNIRESDDSRSLINTVTPNQIKRSIKGYSYVLELIKDKERYDVIPVLFDFLLGIILTFFVKLDVPTKNKLEILNEIYDFEKSLGTPILCSEKWASILNNFIIKRKFKMAIYFSNFLRTIYNVNFFKMMRRIKIQKKN